MKTPFIFFDFETRSAVDLRKVGLDVYAKHKTTDILCTAYAINGSGVKLFSLGQPLPQDLKIALKNGSAFIAHNAAFELALWQHVGVKKYGWPELPREQIFCCMVEGYALGLPGSLENLGSALGLPIAKDMQGNRIMLQLCKPRNISDDGKILWWRPEDSTPQLDINQKYKIVYNYCKQDVKVTRDAKARLLNLNDFERKTWLLDQKINNRGVFVDLPAIKKAIAVVEVEKKRLDKRMQELTGGVVSTCNSSVALIKWVQDFGIVCDSVAKDKILNFLDIADQLPKTIIDALLVRKEAAKSSTAKLKKMLEGASDDGRVRGCFQYYGAASTGRWAGRRIQLQNMPRPFLPHRHIEDIVKVLGFNWTIEKTIEYIDMLYGSPMSAISDSLRAMLCAPEGSQLYGCDYSAIEGRVLAWLAGQENKLKIYRGSGKVYEATAADIYNVLMENVTKDQRLVGKVAELALGYQGGIGAFQSMAKNYNLKIKDKVANAIKKAWRIANPAIERYWYNLEKAAVAAVENENQKFSVGADNCQVTFLKSGSFLFCRLPSGRAICYPYPKMKMKTVKFLTENKDDPDGPLIEKRITKEALCYKGEQNYKFVERVAYGGLIAENITQATARDLLAEALHRLEARNYPVVMHVHDEAVAERKIGEGSEIEIEKIMCELPAWAEGLPIDAEAWAGKRYRK